MFGTYKFFLMAKKWPSFIQYWTNQELVFLNPMYKKPGFSMTVKIRLVAAIIFTFAYGMFGDIIIINMINLIYVLYS